MLRSSHLPLLLLALLTLLLLTACTSPDASLPAVSISAPSVGQRVSGTVQVQVAATDDSGIAKVTVYARAKGSKALGVPVSSATAEPLVVSWFTPASPNRAELELYAKAEDGSGNFNQSDPLWLQTNNLDSASPSFAYLVGYTLPPTGTAAQSLRPDPTRLLPEPLAVRPPAERSPT